MRSMKPPRRNRRRATTFCNEQNLRLRARSAAVLVRQMRPSSTNRANDQPAEHEVDRLGDRRRNVSRRGIVHRATFQSLLR